MSVFYGDLSYCEIFVYGNVFVEGDGEGNSQIVYYGGDSGNVVCYCKGILYFFYNIVVLECSGNMMFLCLLMNDEIVDVCNNVFYVEQMGFCLVMFNVVGVFDLMCNWIKLGW